MPPLEDILMVIGDNGKSRSSSNSASEFSLISRNSDFCCNNTSISGIHPIHLFRFAS